MTSPGRSALTWIGRLFLLAVPLVVLCGLFQPQALGPVERVICDEGLSLAIEGNDPGDPTDNRASCESDAEIVDATGRVFAVAGICFVLAVGAYTLRNRVTPRSLSAPQTPHHA